MEAIAANIGPVAIGFGTLAGLLFVIRLALVYQRQVTQAIIEENERLRKLLANKENPGTWADPEPSTGAGSAPKD